jgi:hypothetical protein
MTLEELKALWDAAVAALKADPENADLKAKAEEAQAAYEEAKEREEGSGDPSGALDESKLDEKTKAYIAKLRKENASHRTKNKELASKFKGSEEQKKAILKAAGLLEEEKPEEKLQAASAANNSLAFRNAILETAVEHGIPKDKLKYYQFLVSEAMEEVAEGEELSDEKLAEIVAECKKGGSGKAANSTVIKLDKDGKPVTPPPPGESGKMTLEKFCSLSMVEKSKLYQTSPAVYEEFMNLAKSKKKLI